MPDPYFGSGVREKELKSLALGSVEDNRYFALNTCNRSTIEFRLWNGSLRPDTVLATIELTSNICRYAMSATFREVCESKWTDMLYSNTSYRYSRSWRDFNYSWLKSDISSREYESCMDDIDGSYTYKTIMWVTDGFLAGVDSDSMADEMFAVDPANNVYVYDYDKDALVLMPGASAWSCNGTAIQSA